MSWLSSGFMLYWRQKKAICAVTCGLRTWQKNGRVSLLTTPLTTYGFGLPGFSAAKSTRKQSIRTQNPRKARKITQKIRFLAFGMRGSHVRVVSLRPYRVFVTDLRTLFLYSDPSWTPTPNSRNPNPKPVGEGFGFLFVLGDMWCWPAVVGITPEHRPSKYPW